MYNNLNAEFVRLNIPPCTGISEALKCSERVARNRLSGYTPFTVNEAIKVRDKWFPEMSIDFLFKT
jgi:hypothetical protein